MNKFLPYLLAISLTAVILLSNPSTLTAPQLMTILFVVGWTVVYVVRVCLERVKKLFKTTEDLEAKPANLTSFWATSCLILVFLYLLNVTGTLSMRDVVLSVVLAWVCRFYLERRFSNA